jgi:hypothetical protein
LNNIAFAMDDAGNIIDVFSQTLVKPFFVLDYFLHRIM